MKRIFTIQQALKVNKDEKGQNYKYRTLPSELEALLPMLNDAGMVMLTPIDYVCNGGQPYVVAHCQVFDAESGKMVAETTYPTMDSNPMIKGGQGTGAACTYAKKGAIDAMFHLDAGNPDLLDLDDTDLLQKLADKTKTKTNDTGNGNGNGNNNENGGKRIITRDMIQKKEWQEWGLGRMSRGQKLSDAIAEQDCIIAPNVLQEFEGLIHENYNI